MSILFNLAKSICIPKYATKLTILPNRFSSSHTLGWICPKFEDPPVCKVEIEDPCDFKKPGCESKESRICKPPSQSRNRKTKSADCNFVSVWENPCCKDPCPDLLPRFDDLYYKESDKKARIYTRTWEECPTIKVICKKVCCLDKMKPPEYETRCLKRCPSDACPIGKNNCYQRLMCLFGNDKKCLKTKMPCCRGARNPPSCKRETVRVKCTKRCTQYPSYSECTKRKPGPLHPTECRCLDVPPWCLALRAKRSMGA